MRAWTERAAERGAIGVVSAIKGSRITFDVAAPEQGPEARVTVGSFVGIRADETCLVGIVTALTAESFGDGGRGVRARADLDLIGEIRRDGIGNGLGAQSGLDRPAFRRGVASYPAIGDAVEPLPPASMRLVYQVAAADTVEIGTLSHDPGMPACLKVDDLLSKHFAVLGTTGVGKSSGVAVILDRILRARGDLRVFLLDVHNEYGRCFGARAAVIGPHTLKLPFWLFNLEETVDVVYGGRPPVEEEIEILAELIPAAKNRYAQYKDTNREPGERGGLVKRASPRGVGYTVDTPVPYLMQDLIALIDERMGRLENRAARMHYHRLIARIDAIRNDPRYAFMFENANVGGDMMGELLTRLFRLEPDGVPMTIMQLGGLPAEVVDAVVCVLCRLAFEHGVWSDGATPLLFVCEEAHRYASADRSTGFAPTRRALSRIAKEGRKHGVFLGLVTQRPAELDPTVISQCSTLFAMRMSNDRDQAFLKAAVSDAANLLSFVPLLGTGEVIAFGEGVPLPARMSFRRLSEDRLPRSETAFRALAGRRAVGEDATAALSTVIERWRGATMSKGAEAEHGRPAREHGTDAGAALDQAHRRLLRRPLRFAEAAEAVEPAAGEARAPVAQALSQPKSQPMSQPLPQAAPADPGAAGPLWQLR